MIGPFSHNSFYNNISFVEEIQSEINYYHSNTSLDEDNEDNFISYFEDLSIMIDKSSQTEVPNWFRRLNLNEEQEPTSLNIDKDPRYFTAKASTNKNNALKKDNSKKPNKKKKNNLTKEKSYIGKKRKSNHQKKEAETIEVNDSSDKKDEPKSYKKSANNQKIIKDFKQTFQLNKQKFIDECKKIESNENINKFNFILRFIFYFLMNIFVYYDDSKIDITEKDNEDINGIEDDFENLEWEAFLKQYNNKMGFSYICLDELIDLIKATQLVEKKPISYFKKVITEYFRDPKKYRVDKRMIKNFLKTNICLILLQGKKEINEENIENNNINNNFTDSQPDGCGDSEEKLNSNFKDVGENKPFSSGDDDDLKEDINNKSTNCASNETNNTKTFKIEKGNRSDNLSNVLKNMILKAFKIVFRETIKKNNFFSEEKIQKKKFCVSKAQSKNKKEKKEELDFMQTDFTEYAEKLKEDLKIKEINEEAENLIKMTKKEFLKGIMEDNYKEFITKKEFFDDDEEEQKAYFKQLNCKIKAIEIFKSNDLEGLILLTKLINIDQDFNIKIINPDDFEEIIQNLEGNQNFSINLNDIEYENIKRRRNRLEEKAKKYIK